MKAKFGSGPVLELIGSLENGRPIYSLVYEFSFTTSQGEVITVPPKFVTDLASVPRLPIAFMLAGDTAPKSAVIHDYLYKFKICEKERADAIFYEAMEIEGVSLWRRILIYTGVRIGGRTTWEKNKPINLPVPSQPPQEAP
jgi:hypothetical protein